MDFRNPHKIGWFDATVTQKRGNVLYQINGARGVCFRHANQLRPNKTGNVPVPTNLDFEEFMEIFRQPNNNNLDHQPQEPNPIVLNSQDPKPFQAEDSSQIRNESPETELIRRRSPRNRKPVVHFDPTQARKQDQERQRQRRLEEQLVAHIFVF